MTIDQNSLTLDVVFGEAFASILMIMIMTVDQILLTLDVVLGEAFASSRRFTICE